MDHHGTSDEVTRQSAEDIAETEAQPSSEQRENSSFRELRERRADLLKGTIERREFPAESFECRTLDDGTLRAGGWGSITERWYDVGDPERGGWREKISRSSFRRTLNEQPDVVLLVNHEGLPLARTKNQSLTLSEDARGLRWDADLDAEDPDSKALARKIERGLLDECSFAFMCTSDSWSDDYSERTITALSMHRGDVSVVTHGANDATSVTMLRSVSDDLEQRAGKSLSAQTRTELAAIRDQIDDLLSSKDKPAEAAEAAEAPELIEVLAEAGRDAVEETMARDAEVEPETRQVLPDYSAREREQLAKYRRAA